MREHQVAVAAIQRQSHLGDQQAIAGAEVIAASDGFEGEILLVADEFGESSRKRDGRRIGEHPAKQVHHCRGEYVDAEEAEIVTGADAWHEEPLFGFGGRGLLEDGIDAIEAGPLGETAACDGPEVRQEALARGLHAGDGTLCGLGQFDQALDARLAAADV